MEKLLVWAARRVIEAHAMTEPAAFAAYLAHQKTHRGCGGADGCAEARRLHDAWLEAQASQAQVA